MASILGSLSGQAPLCHPQFNSFLQEEVIHSGIDLTNATEATATMCHDNKNWGTTTVISFYTRTKCKDGVITNRNIFTSVKKIFTLAGVQLWGTEKIKDRHEKIPINGDQSNGVYEDTYTVPLTFIGLYIATLCLCAAVITLSIAMFL